MGGRDSGFGIRGSGERRPEARGTEEAERRIRAAGRRLDLSGLGLEKLLESIAGLRELAELDLSGNELTELPEWIGALSRVHMLLIGGNRLTALPVGLGRLKRLRFLNISGNPLGSLPEWIGERLNLQYLWADGIGLTILPQSLCDLNELKQLSINGHSLTELPETIGLLTNLEGLYLQTKTGASGLTSLPEGMRLLTSLIWLYLHGNAELGLPPEILGPALDEGASKAADPAAILEYYFRTRSTAARTRPLHEAKLILVGRGGAGKTSLVNRLVHRTYNSKETKTDGIAITDWPVEVGGDKVQLHIWDFGR